MADFYGTVEDADTYHDARANAAWTGTDEAKQAALVRASQYVDGRYRWRLASGRWQSMFRGAKAGGRAQALEWPRTGATDYEGNEIPDDEVPIEVEHATYEAALRELVAPGSLSPDYTASAQVTKEKVGPVEVQYAESKATDNMAPNRPVIPAIDEIIAPVVFRPYEFPAVTVV
jgi:hypothetical protein